VVTDNEYVSTVHCRVILTDDGRILVEDLGSVNGTYVRSETGELFQVQRRLGAHQMVPGDTLIVGRLELPWVTRTCVRCGQLMQWRPTPAYGGWPAYGRWNHGDPDLDDDHDVEMGN
jgi:hypothetical protein